MASISRLDKLGKRLKSGAASEDDLRLLAEHIASFSEAFEGVKATVRACTGFPPTGREKTTRAIEAKLRRLNTRLSTMQDVVGCRIVVPDVRAQDAALQELLVAFPDGRVDDRRNRPSHGYRAVHVVVAAAGRVVEVQVRTGLQHEWAEISEALFVLIDEDLKYGGGPLDVRDELMRLSASIAACEDAERGSSEDLQGKPSEIAQVKAALAQWTRRVRELQQPRGNS